MRVALLSHNAQAGDAIGNQVAEKIAFFLDRGADVRVFVESDRRLHPAVRPHCSVLSPDGPEEDGWRFVSSADLVLVEYGQYYRLLERLPLLGAGKGRVLFDYHGVTPPELWPAHNHEGIAAGVRHRGLVWCADAALAHSRFTAGELQEATGFDGGRLSCLGHPVDRELFRPGPAGQSLGRLLGVGEASFLLFVGRLAPNKRVPLLIEALARLRDRTPAVHAVVVGDTGDVYRVEAERCRELAAHLGVADRLHFLGQVPCSQLLDAYRSADVLVMPSVHEGFCIPVIEAMACGLPVVAARAGALPETVGDAGLTFRADDAGDLAGVVRRVLESAERGARSAERSPRCAPRSAPDAPRLHVAVVAFRYGTDFAGGAEASLRKIAETLREQGHHVEVFTTCTREAHDWSNQLPEGTTAVGGIAVHRHRLDPHDHARHLETVRAVLQSEGPVSPEVERDYLEHSLHSSRLIEALGRRLGEFDAVVTGPYLYGLTLDVARAFPGKTLLLPCFHDEPFARLRAWAEYYPRTGGILYHSAEEQAFAEAQLGINHPGASCVGGVIDVAPPRTRDEGQGTNEELALEPPFVLPLTGRYLVYCGRYAGEKRLPVLLDYARRYQELQPGRFAFVFLGQGEVAIPRVPGFHDLGFVDEPVKRDVLGQAAALVQLSRYESLSYAALEAWAEGTPVVADAGCAVLAGHLRRCGGGRAVGSFEEFAAALDDLAEQPERWRELGRQGREYVHVYYGDWKEFARKLEEAVRGLSVPLAERMRLRGLERAARHDRVVWREQFAELVEELLDAGPRPYQEQVEVKPRSTTRTVAAGAETALVPVRVVNRGSHALLAEGPGRSVLRCQVLEAVGDRERESHPLSSGTPLPGLLMPGRALAAGVAVPVPAIPGTYRVGFWVERDKAAAGPAAVAEYSWLQLVVEGREQGEQRSATSDNWCAPLLEGAQNALAEASRLARLPDDYLDVTEGLFAVWKRRIKRKLLGNFKHAYVDVLSRQQSAFNRFLIAALQEVAECCRTLGHQQAVIGQPPSADTVAVLVGELAESRQRCAALEERLARLEAENDSARGSVVRLQETQG